LTVATGASFARPDPRITVVGGGLIAAAAGAAAAGAAAVIPTGTPLEMFASLIVAAAFAGALLSPPGWSLAILVGYSGISGFVKESGNWSPFVHLSNDLVLSGVLAGWTLRIIANRSVRKQFLPFKAALAVLCGSALALSFAPWTTWIQALGGLKVYVLPALLVLVAAASLEKPGSLAPVWFAVIGSGLANALASLVERVIGDAQIATWGPGFLPVTVGGSTHSWTNGLGLWRPFGLAQDAGAASSIEATAAIVLVGLSLHTGRHRSLAIFTGAALAATVVLSGVRTSVIMLFVGILAATLLARRRDHAGPSRLVSILAIIAVILTCSVALSLSRPAASARLGTLAAVDTFGSNRGMLFLEMPGRLMSAPLGVGMGKVVPGSATLSTLAGVDSQAFASENMLLSLTLELGVFGLLFAVLFFATVTRASIAHITRNSRDSEMGVAIAVCAAIFVAGLAYAVFMAQPVNVVLWILATAVAVRSRGLTTGAVEAIAARGHEV
jgi:hypothetical protein